MTLGFTGSAPNVRDGIGAAVTITTAQARNPSRSRPPRCPGRPPATSSPSSLAARPGVPRSQVGAVDADYVQITRGIMAGPTVVLADLDQAVPSSSTSTCFGPRGGTFTRPGG